MNLFVEIGEKQIIIIEISSVLIFSTWPIPGAPGLTLISKPPWYDAKTSPNPFQENTTIQYQLKTIAQVTIAVYDAQGKEVKVLVNKKQPAGSYTETFNGKGLGAGIYFVKIIKDGEVKQTLKLVKE